jgi:glycogen debranching enzyme
MTAGHDESRGPARPRGKRRRDNGAADTGPYYIVAASPAADERSRVLKQGDTFAVFDHYGDIKPGGLGEEGLYHEGTRFLSYLLLRLGKERPLFLSSIVREDNELLAVDLTNPDIPGGERPAVPRGTLHVARTRFLWQGVCYDRLHLRNFGLAPITACLAFQFEADFADIFEVRGTRRRKRGRDLDGVAEDSRVVLAYEGLDGVVRRTRLTWSPRPAELAEDEARFELALPPRGEAAIDLAVACEVGGATPRVLSYDAARAESGDGLGQARARRCSVNASSEPFNDWVRRSDADLYMMTTETPEGPYPYAGVPWFSTPFGRDGILTALECLAFHPGLARGVLRYLADTQATEVIPAQDAEPGKILHEARRGEMAALGEIPFGRYYGSVDATPLFVLLAGAYYERTADHELVKAIWPNLEAALRWLDTYGDPDGDGFVEYQRHSADGLIQQGWKDSHDSVFHADGTLARGPIALCEVQGYAYAARRAGAALAAVLGLPDRVEQLSRQARELQEKFQRAFWCEDLGTYALALDGDKRPCRVCASNAGHCLLTEIASPEHAPRVAATLLGKSGFSGWGVRTLADSEARYNPMSYHNGSVWPHDNALIAEGLARYGLKEGALQILEGLFDASLFLDLHRLPELFCGFPRRPGEGPTLYPVACSPQSWASAAVYLLLQACLGLRVSGPRAQVAFFYPQLPPSLREVRVLNLSVARAEVDLRLIRHGADVGINVLRREGNVEICMVK